jgi:Domain of unknown function (DU1801)
MQSKAKTPKEYLASLPDDRKHAVSEIRKVILKNLPKGFEEVMDGMLGYVVPHSLYPGGYHCDPKTPLPFIGLASQKNYIAFYHMGLYAGAHLEWFQEQWKIVSPKKLDMGKCCVRFKKFEDVPLDLIGQLCAKMKPQQWIDIYESHLKR